ncbi:MAG: L-arabinose isomerase [candidate division TA06 bacterium ADurb.Bin417]|uniref:L-arabinose isomerase n=1 Tax=candidate division TA06 bacterium ADurb.Bin417 TaxID=1852828 RepID=A0A1V5M825_UNCT6|nr:MAG: L-arabinose isomerase [candidate division TA06 bacterium ADurb.Bin417]
MAEERLNGLGINFMAFEGAEGAEAIPFAAISKLMAEGLGYGGEGDILCAAAVLILHGLAGAGNFVEMFTTDYRNDRIFMSHMGESNPNLARDPKSVRLARKEMSLIKPGLATTSLLFQLKPGPVTLLNLAPGRDGLNFIMARGRVLAKPWFPGLDVPNFMLKIPGRVENFLTGYSRLGGTHHLGLAYGDQRPALRLLAEQLGRPAFEVGEEG